MTLTIRLRLPAVLMLAHVLAWSAPAYARTEARPPNSAPPGSSSTAARINLYSPRVRRATIMYLRLRLLELREEDLDRARAAIERRLNVDALLAPSGQATPAAGSSAGAASPHP